VIDSVILAIKMMMLEKMIVWKHVKNIMVIKQKLIGELLQDVLLDF
jgi:hypothetical protein